MNYSKSRVISTSFVERLKYPYFVATALFVVAFGIRSYRLEWNPLWLDELYGYQLGQIGLAAIIRNTMYVPHPPLYYFLLYLTSGFGTFHAEWAWRWFSVLCGSLSVPLLYFLARKMVATLPALLASGLFMLSPTHIFYSQEARPYALLMCLVLATTILLPLINERNGQKAWTLFIVLSIVGIWSSYSFVMVIGAHCLYFLLVMRHWRRIIIYGICIVVSCLPLVGFSIKTLGATHAIYLSQTPLTVQSLAQALLVDDPLRYGFFWAHSWVILCFGVLMLVGVLRAIGLWGRGAALYHVIQLVFPVGAFFGVAGVALHFTLPAFEWRQFLILMPSCFVLLALGFDLLWEQRFLWVGKAAVVAMCAMVLYADGQSLPRYWTITKSPEGLTARFVRDNAKPTDAVVSFHYSLDAASSFYVPNNDVFTKPQNNAGELVFTRSPSILPGEQSGVTHDATVSAIRQHQRIWLMVRLPIESAVLRPITEHCSLGTPQNFPPFQVILVQRCR